MPYKALVCKLSRVYTHPNADRIQLAKASGYQIIIGLDQEAGDLGVLFEPDGQLSVEFTTEHDLIARHDPETGEKAGGYFSKNRRVRAQKFRGVRSEGFWVPIDWLTFTGYDISTLRDGDEFAELGGVHICNKYITKATQASGKRAVKSHRKETRMFPMHVSTGQLRKQIRYTPTESRITVTEKVHGTSHRFGFVMDEARKRSFFDKLLRRDPQKDWVYMSGSRRVVLRSDVPDMYYGNGFREEACANIIGKLNKGEVIFFEIVGYTHNDKLIMEPQDTKKLKDVKKKYGSKMEYTYGCVPGQHRIMVYRMIMVNEDGFHVEYPWETAVRRCEEIGIEHVPVLGADMNLSQSDIVDWVTPLVDGDSVLDSRHIREGVVVRIDSTRGTEWMKHKSFTFGLLEGYLKESDLYIDMEEAS